MACTACLVCFISTVNGHCIQKKKRKEAYTWKAGSSSGHTTNLKQSILETFNIYDTNIYSYLEASGGQNSKTYLKVVHFFNTSVNWTSVAA
jgi:hypothetical protein